MASIEDLKVKLTKLREIDYTALDYETIQQELLEYAEIASSNANIQDDFLNGDAAKLFLDLFSYIGELNSFRIDTLSNEHYLPTANRRQSIIDLLELVGQKVLNPTSAQVTVTAIPSTVSGTNITVPARTQLPAVGLDGNEVFFEIMSEENDYFTNLVVPAGVTNYNLKAFSGVYSSLDVVSTGEPNLSISLPQFPVIEGSVKVSVTPITQEFLTPEIIVSSRSTEVDSLISSPDEIIHQVKYDEDGRARVVFAGESFGKIPPRGNTIHIDYRTGGGANTNINIGSIDSTVTLFNTGGQSVSVAFTNDVEAVNGNDQQDLEEVKLLAPSLVRSNNNLVAIDDYAAVIRNLGAVQDVFAVDYITDNSLYGGKFEVDTNSVKIWVLPTNGGEVGPDLRQIIANELEVRRLVAIENFVFSPQYINWDLNATVRVSSIYDETEVRSNIISTLLAKYGEGVSSFNNEILYSQLISTIQGVEGVVDVTLVAPTTTLSAEENQVLRLVESNIVLNINSV